MKKSARIQIFLISTTLLCSCFAVEVDTKIELDGKNPPGFSLSGNGQLWFVEVRDISPSNLSHDAPERTIWKITTPGGIPSAYPKIRYGVVPSGFTQEIPANGAPAALVEEKPYSVFANTSNANGDSVMFLIRGGKALKITMSQDGSYFVQGAAR